MNRPFISVIVPVYNCSRFIGECIESILSGNEAVDFELVLVDDGSSDTSLQVCRSYASIYPDKIKVWHKENGGVSSARNYGLQKAIGEWVVFVDADDELVSGALALLHERLKDGDSDLLQFGMTRGVDVKCELSSTREVKDYVAEGCCHLCMGGNVFRNETVKEHFICFDEEISLAEDQLFVMTYLKNVSNVKRIPDVLYIYRENDTSASNTPSSSKLLASYGKLLVFKMDNGMFAEMIDNTLLSFMYILILHGEVNLKELEQLYKKSCISSKVITSDTGSRGIIAFKRMICRLNFRLSSVLVRIIKRISDAIS